MNNKEDHDALNPFIAIWRHPRAVVRQVIDEKSSGFLLLLIVLAGFSTGVLTSLVSPGPFSVGRTLLSGVFLGPVTMVGSAAFGAGMYWLIGKLFRGKSTYTEMLQAVLTAHIPQIWLLPLLVLWLLLRPETYFLLSDDQPFFATDLLTLIFKVGIGIVGAWGFFIFCKAISEAHRFSVWKGFFCIFIPAVLSIAVIAGLFIFFFTVLLPFVAGGN